MKIWFAVVMIVLLTAGAYAEEQLQIGTMSSGARYITDRVIVTVLPGTPALNTYKTTSGIAVTGNDGIDLLCARFNVIAVEPYYPHLVRNEILRSLVERMYLFKLAPGEDALDVKDYFLANKDIELSDAWEIDELLYTPNDPALNSQWALPKISAFQAWDLMRGDSTANVVISINDTGVYYMHPDLQANMYINGPEDINQNGIFDNFPEGQGGDLNNYDDDGNGYMDDVVGYDLGRADPDPAEDSPTHGTHVAGCASEVADNSIGGAGIGFAAKIQATKITNANGDLTQGYSGMIYAADNGVDIINISWGSNYYSPSNQNVCNYVANAGVLIVAAAGNDDYWTPPYNNYPSAYDNVLAVAATDQNDHMAGFSNYSPWVDISAPGINIYSTWTPSSYASLSGTSMSSPIVAGVAALVKAQNPDADPDELTNILMFSADNIDSLNPNYEGLIGAGRVNAYAALGASNYPNIRLYGFSVEQTSDDGDGIINPGESIDLTVTLQNVWQDAENVTATLTGPEGITITDGDYQIGDFPGGGEMMDNGADPFGLTYNDDITPGEYILTLTITADDSYETELEIPVSVSLSMPDFPISLPDAIESHPLICDFDRNGTYQILIGCNDHKLYSIELNGSSTPGWPVTGSDDFTTGAAVGDLDGDGDFEIVASTGNGDIMAMDHQGNILPGFPIETGGSLFATPSLADLDGDGHLEIIQPGFFTRDLDVFSYDGTSFGNWPFSSSNYWYGSASVGDIDGDGALEIVVGGFDNMLHVFNADKTEATGFPIELDNRVWVAPAIGNIDPADPEPEIAVGTQSGSVYLVNHDGSLVSGWPVNIGAQIKSSPALGDLDGDGTPEIVFGAEDSKLYAYDADASAWSGFPITLSSPISVSPAIADISGDGSPDIIIGNGTTETYLYAFDASGQMVRNFPIPTTAPGEISVTPAVWDMDRDGDMEIVFGIQNSGLNVELIDYKEPASLADINWAAFGNDQYRSGNFDALNPVSVGESGDALPAVFGLTQNYPNPFNSRTVISYSIDKPSHVTLEVYDILGRKTATLVSGMAAAGTHEVIWDGRSGGGDAVASGIYFYRLTAGDRTSVKRLLYLK